jgi:hypothetical protein
MKATEHIAVTRSGYRVAPKAPTPKVEPKEERPPENVSAIQKQVDKLEAQSLTSDQEAAVAEIRSILGLAPDSPEIDHELPEPEPEPPAKSESEPEIKRKA